jgi:tagatose 1,6-diphosphate aldolase GatY/KbaY
MLVNASNLLNAAGEGSYAIGAFNVYNLEGVLAVINAAESEYSPVMLQLHPGSLDHGGKPLVSLCLTAASEARVPVAVHLDHSSKSDDIRFALYAGLASVMADGSALGYRENIEFTRAMAEMAHQAGATVEAELGRLSGAEDGMAVAERDSRMTDPGKAHEFVTETGIDSLAVCIGNVHGNYHGEPRIDFGRLQKIRSAVAVPLVLHGASGLSPELIHRSIEIGIAKFNVNTELRSAYIGTLREQLSASKAPELVDLMNSAIKAMQAVVQQKLQLFRSSGKFAW